MQVPAKFKYAAAAVLACALCFMIGAMAAGGGRQVKARVSSLASSAKKRLSILAKGEEKYVKDELDKNYSKQDKPASHAPRSLDTSRLPLSIEVVPLAGSSGFAGDEDLIRGALTVVENSIFAMDKLGNIFRVEGKTLKRMNYGTFPSSVERYLLDAPQGLPRTSLRALYLAYDKSRSALLVSHQRYNPASRHVRFTISALPIDAKSAEKAGEWRTVFETEDIPDKSSFRGATGGKLVVSGNVLYFTVGDYNFGQVPQDEAALVAQDPKSSFGKVYEHDLATGRTKVKSTGHRNPQGLVLTRSGRLIDAEHGPEGGDELNIVKDGSNYGWPYKTYGTDYGTFNWPMKSRREGVQFSEPLYSWVPSAAVSPVIEVSDFNEAWDGDLLVGSLKAQTLFRLKLVDERVVLAEPIWIGHRIRDIAQIDHRIVLMTDDPALVFIALDEQRLTNNSKFQKHVEFSPALSSCLNCHHFGQTNPSHLAPSLANVIGRRIAGDTFDRYSDALKKKGGTWDEASLRRFLSNPTEFSPGTAMPNLGLTQAEVEEAVTSLGRRITP